MHVLHAGVSDSGGLLLWAEQADAEESPAPAAEQGTSEPRGAGRLLPHPLDAGPQGIRAALKAGTEDLPSKGTRTRRMSVRLPTVDERPVPSSALVAPPPDVRHKPTHRPWRITVLPLAPSEAVGLLTAAMDRRTLATGVVVGDDLSFWCDALRFVASLVARQRFLPGLKELAGRYRAVWEPVISGADSQRLATVAGAMPAAARALSHATPGDDAEETEAAEPSAEAAVEVFVEATTDALVRSSAGRETAKGTKRKRREGSGDSVHDEWLRALAATDGTMHASETDLKELAAQVRQWKRPIAIAAESPLRLCFRLEEPEDGELTEDEAAETTWYVRYLLQPTHDPSLLVPARDVWEGTGEAAALLQNHGFNPAEYLLQALGEAAALSPGIEQSLEEASPEGYPLDAPGAYAFLTETAPALEEAGFGVMLPSWWAGGATRARIAAKARAAPAERAGMDAGGQLSLSDLVDVRWEVAVGDERLTREELEALARAKAPLVKMRGQWVQVSREEIQAARALWDQDRGETLTADQIVRMALGADHPAKGIHFEGVEGTGWIGSLLSKLEGGHRVEPLPTPAGFHGELREYQRRGYAWLGFLREWGLGACLADDMGLGKTIQTLALIQRDRERAAEQGAKVRPVLLVCPTSVLTNWRKEAERFTPDLPVAVHHGPERPKGEAFRKGAEEHAMVLTSYSLLQRDLTPFQKVDWLGVVLDEAQNIKNPATKQGQAARAIRADYRVALTGTPIENSVGELWSIMAFLNPGLLGTQHAFKEEFLVPIHAYRDTRAMERLRRITRPFILRRSKTDPEVVSDLPAKVENKVYCNLTREQASLYAAVVREAEAQLQASEGIQRKGVVLATLSKLKQVCNHPVQFLADNSSIDTRSGKLARLAQMLEEILQAGDRAVVFTQFAEMGAILKRALQDQFGREVPFLHGGVPKRHRDKLVERFQSDDGPPLFILSLKAGGTGLNLTAANHVFHFDRWWNPAVEDQATDRTFRIGQRKDVEVHKFVCAGTVEERIDQMIEEKKEIAGQVVGTGEDWLTELSTDQLRDLFELREADAVAE